MNSGQTSERVYEALKRKLLSGSVAPGDRIEPASLADELASSTTPVRDALHHLMGERLVESRPSEGFHLPLVNEPALRDLYSWNAQLTKMAIMSWPRSACEPMANDLPIDLDRATRAFFALIAARSGNAEIAVQIDAASDKLATARIAERQVLISLEDELRDLALAFDHESGSTLARLVMAYHRRRLRIVPDIIRILYRS